ncbi:hypothetical protein ACP275_05G094700 [Erythranthe tilingii]
MRILGTSFLYAFCLLEFATILVSPITTEKEILLQFKGNVSIDPFDSLISWNPENNPCQDYVGVSCNSVGNVEKIVLWNTGLVGVLSSALSGLKSLRIITLFGNRFSGNIPFEYGGIDALWKINLSSNALSGSIPEFLGDLPNIRFLDLSRNGYSGEIPSALFKNCYRTRFVSFAHNNLSGPIPISVGNCSNLEGVDLSFNILSGVLPLEICSILNLTYLSVRSNALSGNVRVSQCRNLDLLDLGSNMFNGPAPFEVLGLPNLAYFNISWNGFEGAISEFGTCAESFEVFDVSGNALYGEIPSSINKCSSLKYLDLGFNRFNGSIPVGISDLKNLVVIRLANNSINGAIPSEFGSIEWLEVLDLHNLELVGEIPNEIAQCQFLLELDVSRNYLEGEIPQNLDNMTHLVILDLHHNKLDGSIPSTIGNLSNMRVLDFSENILSGSIPFTLGNLNNLTQFNLSYNNLIGLIPSFQTIQKFGPSAFSNNPGLCGPPLDNPCLGGGGASTLTSRKPKLSASAIIAIIAACLIITGVCVITIINTKARRRRRRNRREEDETMVLESTPLASSTESNVIIGKLVLFSKTLPSKYEDWEAGTKSLLDKECIIGGGSIGTVYKTTFEGGNGISIAVKKLETLGRIRNQDEFEQEIGPLGSFRNPNLVAVQGYYWSSSMQLILMEFVPNGNLYDNLHGLGYPGTSKGYGNPELNWSRRFRIALGIARALAYLHHDCKPQVLHLNIKSTNILLDENYLGKLSDFGLRKLLPKIHNAVGYVAPELAQSSRISDKCDVYSFGVVLLELVTGRKPVEGVLGNEVVILCEYVRSLIERGSFSECFDRNLRGFVETEVVQVMKLGLICTSEIPSRRPSMAEVVQVLETVRNGSEL